MENFHDLAVQKYWTFPASFKGDKFIETKNMIFSGEYIGSRKMDGAFYKFWKDGKGNMELLGRSKSVSGDYLNKIEWVPQLQNFFNSMPNGTCLIGEIYFPKNEGSNNVTKIMGCLKEKGIARQKEEKLHYYIFDVLAYNGYNLYKSDIETRILNLRAIAESHNNEDYIEFAQYYDGVNLWNKLQEILACGGEGMVITKKGTCYQPGKRPSRQTLKVKKELREHIDCFFTGRISKPTRLYNGIEIETWKYWENIKTGELLEGDFYKNYSDGEPIEPVTKPYFNHWAGSLEIGVLKTTNNEQKIYPIGFLSGLTDDVKSNWKDYKFKCIEVSGMEILETGGIRHPKLYCFRDDLSIKDCTYEKFMGDR